MDLYKSMDSFTRVAKARSFAGAAEGLGVSRAIMSKRIKDLEDHLGVRLLHRTTRRLSLTEIGRRYYAFCTQVLDQIGAQHEEVSQLQNATRGEIKLLAPKSFGNLHLATLIADFVATHEQINVSMLLTDDSFNSLNMIDNGIDLAIRVTEARDSSIVTRRIGSLRWLLCASPEYLSAEGAPKRPEDLARHNCLAHLKYLSDGILHLKGPSGSRAVKLVGRFAANSSLALRAGALRGLGIALLPAYCAGEDIEQGRLVRVLSRYAVPVQPVFALYPHQRFVPTKVRLLINHLAERLIAAKV
jgi:DNA-binding transcriptional LysR family regulator